MASGMTFVDAINELVETIGEFPMAGVTKPSAQAPADTTSIYYQAERFVTRESQRFQSLGWPENTTMSKQFTATDDKIALSNTTLRVRAAGPDRHRNLVIRDDGGTQRLYDADRKTFRFFDVDDYGHTSAGTVYLDVVDELDFDDLPPLLQDVIVAGAKMKFQRRLQGNPNVDQQLMQEYAMAEQLIDRNKPIFPQNFNIAPIVGGSEPQGRQG